MRRYQYHPYGAADFDIQAGVDVALELATVGETAGAVAALLKAAGVTATAPVYGWIVAGALATAAGIMAFISAADRRTLKVAMVAPLAEQYGFPQAIVFPDFVIEALQPDKGQWRAYQAEKLEKDIAAGKGESWINTAKLQFLGIVEAFDLVRRRMDAGLSMVAPTDAEVKALEKAVGNTKEATKITKKTRKLVIFGGATLVFVALAYLIIED